MVLPHITNEQVSQFLQDGYLICEDLITQSELASLKDEIVALARGQYPCPALPAMGDHLSDAECLNRVLCIHHPHVVCPAIKQYMAHPAIVAVLSRIVGAHLGNWWDGNVKCMQSMFFAKPPGKPGQSWHQDEIYIPTRDRSLCGAWIAVDDATIENGCLWVLPGSHRQGHLYEQRPSGPEFDFAAESFGFDDLAEIPVEVKAGSVVFFNGYLLHRSKQNTSHDYRRALVSHYMTAESKLPWTKVDDQPISVLDRRCVMHVQGDDPYPHLGEDWSDVSAHMRPYETEANAH